MSRCNKCINKKFTFLKIHPCLHEAACVIKDAENLPKPRSVSWAPDKCSTCSSWLDHLRRSCLSVDEKSSLCSLLRAIVDRRRKSRLPEERLWDIFPSKELRTELFPFFSLKGKFPIIPFGITVKFSFPNLAKNFACQPIDDIFLSFFLAATGRPPSRPPSMANSADSRGSCPSGEFLFCNN